MLSISCVHIKRIFNTALFKLVERPLGKHIIIAFGGTIPV